MMRVLLFCPTYPQRPWVDPRTVASIDDLEWKGGLSVMYERDEMPEVIGYGNILKKYLKGREIALAGGYDALLCVEADMIVPPLALERLARISCEVAYGLYVSRHATRRWLAFLELNANKGKSLSDNPELARKLWGGACVTRGAGLGCTLIHRSVLERIPFRADKGGAACDWAFAHDCVDNGITQMTDLGVVCGHITSSKTVLWPDITQEALYREEADNAAL